jgi:hypothetical protein
MPILGRVDSAEACRWNPDLALDAAFHLKDGAGCDRLTRYADDPEFEAVWAWHEHQRFSALQALQKLTLPTVREMASQTHDTVLLAAKATRLKRGRPAAGESLSP